MPTWDNQQELRHRKNTSSGNYYLEANEKNYKISAKKQKQGKESDGIKTLEKTKKKQKRIKTLLNGLNIGMENTEKRFSKPQGTELEFTQIENHTHTHTHT